MAARSSVLRRARRRRVAASSTLLVLVGLGLECRPAPPGAAQPFDGGSLQVADIPIPIPAASTAGANWVDCVGALQVRTLRGYRVANALRWGQANPSLRTASRLADLEASDLRTFCDWEACIRANGYGHVCAINDAGWERCRVCDGGGDCDGLPLSQGACVANAMTAGRAQCHVGLLQECLLQQAIRGPADPRVTNSCQLSAQACAGELPGDVSAAALAAQHETDQVTIEESDRELAVAAQLEPDSAIVTYWQDQLSTWDGGLPPGESEASTEAGTFDAPLEVGP